MGGMGNGLIPSETLDDWPTAYGAVFSRQGQLSFTFLSGKWLKVEWPTGRGGLPDGQSLQNWRTGYDNWRPVVVPAHGDAGCCIAVVLPRSYRTLLPQCLARPSLTRCKAEGSRSTDYKRRLAPGLSNSAADGPGVAPDYHRGCCSGSGHCSVMVRHTPQTHHEAG